MPLIHLTRQCVFEFLRSATAALFLSASITNAATFSVLTNLDAGPGSLRQALLDANSSPDADTIVFALAANSTTIALQSPLPRITNTVLLDGYTQRGVKVLGSSNSVGFEIDAIGVTIRGIAIQNFSDAVRFSGGRSDRVESCTITGNSNSGVTLGGGSDHQILGNTISGNGFGIYDSFRSVGTNLIRGNLIGIDATGTNVLGNASDGIYGSSFSHLIIGGTTPGDANVISGNARVGIFLNSPGQVPSVIQGNFIGTDRSGALNLSNTYGGIYLIGPSNRVGGLEAGAGNIIAFNGGHGISTDSATWIQSNRIFANALLGISGPNTNAPVLSHAGVSSGSTLIIGALMGTPTITYRIEFFAGDACDPSGFGEGRRFLGFTTATPDGTRRGPFAFSLYEALPIPSVVTATATGPEGTSVFSTCQPVTSPVSVDLSVRQTLYPDPPTIVSNITYTLTVSNAGPGCATNVVLDDRLPYQPRLVSVQMSQGTWSNDTGRVVCAFGNLNAGTSAWARVNVNANFESELFFYYPVGGYYTNRASVSCDNIDSVPSNNSSEETTEAGFCDVGVTISLGPAPHRAGAPFRATLHLTNAGPDVALTVGGYLWSNGSSTPLLIAPDTFSVTNLLPRTSQDIALSILPLESGFLSIQLYAFSFQPDTNPTNDSFWVQGYAEPGPGVLTFERDAYAMQENGRAIVRVLRTGGSEGFLSVSYATSNGTATESDYVPTTGTLTFAPGQTNAEITVTAVPDQVSECNEFFSLNLFPADSSTFLGTRSNVLISIAERAPTLFGYVQPVTVNPANPRLLVGDSSYPASISADGRKVAFMNSAPELVGVTSLYAWHIFLRDLDARTTVQVTPNLTNSYGYPTAFYFQPVLSGDGHTLAYVRDFYTNDFTRREIFVRDLRSGSNMPASRGIDVGDFSSPMISSNGATVVFGDSVGSLYAFSPLARSNQLITVASNVPVVPSAWTRSYGMSADGRFVLFESYAGLVALDTNGFPDVYVRDLLTGAAHLVSSNPNGLALGSAGGADISSDGRWVAFVGDGAALTGDTASFRQDICLRDLVSGTIRVVSTDTDSSSYSSDPSMSADGRFVAYQTRSFLSNYTETLVADTQVGTITRVKGSCSDYPVIYGYRLSGDGHFLFFTSPDNDLMDGEFLPNDSNIFRWDRLTGEMALVSVNKTRTGGASGLESMDALSYDGNVVAFTSNGPDVVFGDTNNSYDVFVWQAGTLPQLSIALSNGIVTVSWPTDSPPAVLETRTPESDWETISGPIQEQSGSYIYRTTVGLEAVRFFQLRLL